MALAELERERAKLPVYEPSDDDLVKLLKIAIPLCNDKRKSLDPDKQLAVECIYGVCVALRIYKDQSVAGLRDIMEAALLAPDADVDFFKAHVSRGLSRSVVYLYRRLFYDIEEDRDKTFWVQRNLFVPNKNIRDKNKFDTAYMWKVVAYHGGTESLIKYAIDGYALDDELRAWFRVMGVSEYVKQVLKSSHSHGKLLDSAGTPALGMAAGWDKASEKDDTPIGDTAGVAAALRDAIDRPSPDMVQESEFIASNKFTDEENEA